MKSLVKPKLDFCKSNRTNAWDFEIKNKKRNGTLLSFPHKKHQSNLGMPPELSPFSDSNIWLGLGEHKAMQIEVTSSELEEEI